MHSDIGMNLLQVHLDSVIFSLYEELDYSVFGDVKYDAVIAPDKGAVARASTFIQYMPDDWDDVFMWVGDKQRDFDTGKITGYVLDCEQEDFFNPYRDRKSTRLNSSHLVISYAVFCLKKKTHART